MNLEKYNEQEKQIIENFFKETDNSRLSDKVFLFNNPNSVIHKDNKTAQRIEFITNKLDEYPNLKEDILKNELSILITNIETSHTKSIANSAATIFQKKRREEILDDSYRKLSTWYDKLGDEWVNNNIEIKNVNAWGLNPSFDKIVKLILNNGYSLSGTSDILNSSIGRGNKDLFNLALQAKSEINGPESNEKSFRTPLACYPRMTSKRSREDNEQLYEYMLEQLLFAGADINKFHNSKSSYVHLSALSGNQHQLEKLLQNGAHAFNSWEENEKTYTTVEVLKENKKDNIAKVLEKYIEIQNKQKQTRQLSLKM